MPSFDPGGLDRPIAEPPWEQFAPRPPSLVARMFGGGARYACDKVAAPELYEQECARHAAAESNRRWQLAERCRVYDRQAAEAAKAVAEYNGEVDEFERQFRVADPEAVSGFFTFVLDASDYPELHRTRSNGAMPAGLPVKPPERPRTRPSHRRRSSA